MKKIVPKAKLSKKARRKLNAEKRTTWAFSPITKRVESKKLYNRKKISRTDQEDGSGDFYTAAIIPARIPAGILCPG